jgi:hypothetical protein
VSRPTAYQEALIRNALQVFRVRGDLYERLSNTAHVFERSVSEEIEHRLTESFYTRDVIAQAFGSSHADFIKALALGVQLIEVKTGTNPWDDPTERVELIVLVGKLIKERLFYRFGDVRDWAQILAEQADRKEGVGAEAAEVALSMLSRSPGRPRKPFSL